MVATTRLLLLLVGRCVACMLVPAGMLGWVLLLQEAGRGTGKPHAAAAAILWLCTAMRPPQNRMMGLNSLSAVAGHRTPPSAWWPVAQERFADSATQAESYTTTFHSCGALDCRPHRGWPPTTDVYTCGRTVWRATYKTTYIIAYASGKALMQAQSASTWRKRGVVVAIWLVTTFDSKPKSDQRL
jgi:hypothetical protein